MKTRFKPDKLQSFLLLSLPINKTGLALYWAVSEDAEAAALLGLLPC